MTRLILLSLAAVAALSAVNDRAFWSFALSRPSSFDASSLASVAADQIFPIFCVALFFAALWSVGRGLMRRLALPDDAPTALGLGLGLCALLVALFGAVGHLDNDWFLVLVVGVMASGALLAWADPPKPVFSAAWLRIPLACVGFHALLIALAPPTGYDVTAYHLAIPRLYLRNNGLVPLPWLFHTRWPHLMEVLYSVPLALGCDRAAALIHLGCCAALVWAVWRSADEELGRGVGILAAALLAAQPVLRYVMSDAHSDGALALFHYLAACALWRWSKTRKTNWLILSAALSGVGASCKLQGVVLTAALAFLAWRRERKAVLYFGISALICAPWFLRTWLATGNPVWPFVFGGADHARLLSAGLRDFNGWTFPRDFPLFVRYGPQYLLVPIAVLAFIDREKTTPFARFLLFPALPLALVSSPSHELWRYLMPVVPALAVLAAWQLNRAFESRTWRKPAAVACALYALSPILTLSQGNELFYVSGANPSSGGDRRDAYLARATPYYSFYKEAGGLLSARDKVLLVRDVRGYHLDADYEWFEPLLAYDLADASDLIGELKKRGFTCVVLHDEPGWFTSFTPYPRELTERLQSSIMKDAKLILREGSYSLYRL